MLLPKGWFIFAFIASLNSFALANAKGFKNLPRTKSKYKPSYGVDSA
jgi:hypothetical protein